MTRFDNQGRLIELHLVAMADSKKHGGMVGVAVELVPVILAAWGAERMVFFYAGLLCKAVQNADPDIPELEIHYWIEERYVVDGTLVIPCSENMPWGTRRPNC